MNDILKITVGVVIAQFIRAMILAGFMKLRYGKAGDFWGTVRGVY